MKYGQSLIKYLLIKSDYEEFLILQKNYAVPGVGYPIEIRPTVLDLLNRIQKKTGMVFSDKGYKMFKGRLRTHGYLDDQGDLTQKGYDLVKSTIDKISE